MQILENPASGNRADVSESGRLALHLLPSIRKERPEAVVEQMDLWRERADRLESIYSSWHLNRISGRPPRYDTSPVPQSEIDDSGKAFRVILDIELLKMNDADGLDYNGENEFRYFGKRGSRSYHENDLEHGYLYSSSLCYVHLSLYWLKVLRCVIPFEAVDETYGVLTTLFELTRKCRMDYTQDRILDLVSSRDTGIWSYRTDCESRLVSWMRIVTQCVQKLYREQALASRLWEMIPDVFILMYSPLFWRGQVETAEFHPVFNHDTEWKLHERFNPILREAEHNIDTFWRIWKEYFVRYTVLTHRGWFFRKGLDQNTADILQCGAGIRMLRYYSHVFSGKRYNFPWRRTLDFVRYEAPVSVMSLEPEESFHVTDYGFILAFCKDCRQGDDNGSGKRLSTFGHVCGFTYPQRWHYNDYHVKDKEAHRYDVSGRQRRRFVDHVVLVFHGYLLSLELSGQPARKKQSNRMIPLDSDIMAIFKRCVRGQGPDVTLSHDIHSGYEAVLQRQIVSATSGAERRTETERPRVSESYGKGEYRGSGRGSPWNERSESSNPYRQSSERQRSSRELNQSEHSQSRYRVSDLSEPVWNGETVERRQMTSASSSSTSVRPDIVPYETLGPGRMGIQKKTTRERPFHLNPMGILKKGRYGEAAASSSRIPVPQCFLCHQAVREGGVHCCSGIDVRGRITTEMAVLCLNCIDRLSRLCWPTEEESGMLCRHCKQPVLFADIETLEGIVPVSEDGLLSRFGWLRGIGESDMGKRLLDRFKLEIASPLNQLIESEFIPDIEVPAGDPKEPFVGTGRRVTLGFLMVSPGVHQAYPALGSLNGRRLDEEFRRAFLSTIRGSEIVWHEFVEYCAELIYWNRLQAISLGIAMERWFWPEKYPIPQFVLETRFVTESEAAWWLQVTRSGSPGEKLLSESQWPRDLSLFRSPVPTPIPLYGQYAVNRVEERDHYRSMWRAAAAWWDYLLHRDTGGRSRLSDLKSFADVELYRILLWYLDYMDFEGFYDTVFTTRNDI